MNRIFIFDVDGTVANSSIYTPLIIYFQKHKLYFRLFLLYLLVPFSIVLDFFSRPTHQLVFYSLYKNIYKKYDCYDELMLEFSKKEIAITCDILNHVMDKHTVYFISTNVSVIGIYLNKFSPKKSYLIDVNNINRDVLTDYKEKSIKEIIANNPNCKLFGFGDSKYDMPFLKYCDKGFILKNQKYQRVV